MHKFILVVLLATLASAGSPAQWKDKVIYQLLTDRFAKPGSASCTDLHKYCGGNYEGLISKLDYIAGLGATAIWISPIVANYAEGYHGYWTVDLNKLNENFGSESDLQKLVAAAHAKGLWVMVDVVANHMGPVDMDFKQLSPFSDSSHYHAKCQITDFQNQTQVEICRLANLPDLDQDNSFVKNTLYTWISSIVKKYNLDGIRVDTVPEIRADFWDGFNSAAGVYCLGEVFNGNIDYVSSYQKHMDGVLSYPLFFAVRNAFLNPGSNMQSQLEPILGPNADWWKKFKDNQLLGNFLDNHDNPRFFYERNDISAFKGAMAVTLLSTGIPIIYYGSEQRYAGGVDPANREPLWPNFDTSSELYVFISKILKHRKASALFKEPQIQRYAWSNIYAFSRGETLVATTNIGTHGTDVNFDLTYLPAAWVDGTIVCNILNTSDCVTVSNKKVPIRLTNGEPKIYTLKSKIVE